MLVCNDRREHVDMNHVCDSMLMERRQNNNKKQPLVVGGFEMKTG